MNETISAALREHADGDIHIERLLDAVHAGARRRAWRRRALVGFGAAVVVAALVGVAGLVSARGGPTVADQVPDDGVPRPPRIAGVADVARRPAALGSDPTLFHLDVSGLTGWRHLQWASWSGGEQLAVGLKTGDSVEIEAARSPDKLTWGPAIPSPVKVNGRPAELAHARGGMAVRWQPVPGVWAQVYAGENLDLAIDTAQTVRFDRVYRCAVPFRLTGLVSARMTKCSHDVDADGPRHAANVWLQLGDAEAEYQIAVGRADPVTPNDTIGDRPVEISKPTGAAILEGQIRYAYDWGTAYFWAFYGPIDEAVFRSLVTAFTPVPDSDPAAWPRTPLT